MTLIDEKIRKSLPGIYQQDDKGLDAIAYIKYTINNEISWYISEYDGFEEFYGLVINKDKKK